MLADAIRASGAPAPDAGQDQWWPSRYGEGDQLGTINETTPAKVAAAARLVRDGVVYDLGRTLHSDVPIGSNTPCLATRTTTS